MDILLPVLLLLVAAALAWGPGHHIEFATRVWRQREKLPARIQQLLAEHKDAYVYGNLAADIINMKAYGGHRNHCHRWTIVDDMNEHAESDSARAFVLGYLSHLAADTIAHNHFVPYHLVRFARGRGLGHLYWEMMADRHVPEERWDVIPRLKENNALSELDALINATVPRKALPMGANKLIFDHVLLVSERGAWRKGMQRLHPIEKVKLDKGFLSRFQRAAVERIRLAMTRPGRRALAHVDTTGKAAQKEAAALRKKLVRDTGPGRRRDELGRELAAPFLEGMESPPPDHRRATPVWTPGAPPPARTRRGRGHSGKRK